MRKDLSAALGWTALQLVERPDPKTPRGFVIDDALEDVPRMELDCVRSELRTLQAAGIPPDENLGRPKVEKIREKCPKSQSTNDFYVLKCKPSGWRLYFIVDHDRKRFIFLYAVHKKQNGRDPADVHVCCNRLAKLERFVAAGTAYLAELPEFLVS
jgi:hypothetical protein